MPEHIRALIVILFIATFVFFYAKIALGPVLLKEEFNRWRNAWFAITLLAFLSHNFWIFITLSSLFLLYIAKSEQNKFALFFTLVISIPTIGIYVPGLFSINFARVLSLTILLPFFISFKPNTDVPKFGKPLAEKLLLSYILLSTILQMRGTTFTDALRFGFINFTDIFLPYYAASRAIKDYGQLKKALIALTLTCLVVGAIATFEFRYSWLLYNPLSNVLGTNWNMGKYLGRDDSIRAVASLDHSIVLGFIMMVALGFYLYIGQSINSKTLRLAGYGLIFSGLISALSRGPWVGTATLFLVFIAFGQKAMSRLTLLFIAFIFALPVLSWVPGGEKVINLIPFVGEIDKQNVEYRQKLIDKSILIIEKYPAFGVYEPKKEPEMEDMVQGEGIIDLVNSYLVVALYNGIVGLSLFLGFFLLMLLAIYKKIRKITDKTSEQYLCGRALLATLAAVLVTIFTTSSIGVISIVYWSLAGLIFSYIRVTNLPRVTKTDLASADKNMYPTFRLKTKTITTYAVSQHES
jgi:O-antigen ligase